MTYETRAQDISLCARKLGQLSQLQKRRIVEVLSDFVLQLGVLSSTHSQIAIGRLIGRSM